MAFDALMVASADRRSRPLLLRALETGDVMLLYVAISALADQHDLDALPLIETALDRSGDVGTELVLELALFGDERADTLARKYLDEDGAREYQDQLLLLADRVRR